MELSHPDEQKHHPRHARRIGCVVVLFSLLLIAGLWMLAEFQPKDRFTEADKQAVAKTEALGIAASLPAFQKKYPSTERGRAGVKEAARIDTMLYYDYNTYKNSTSTRTLDNITSFNGRLIAESLTGAKITTATLLAYFDANSTPIRELLRLHEVCSYDELSWTYKSLNDPPVYVKNFLRLRETSRVLMPTAVWLALQDKDTTRAYTIALNWMYLAQSRKVCTTSLVDGMVGIAVDGISMRVFDELLRSSPPPSEEIALRLFDQLDPNRMRRDFLRTTEAEMIWFSQLLRFAAGVTEEVPYTLRGATTDMGKQMQGAFASALARCIKDLSEFRVPSNYPTPGMLMMKFPGFMRRKIAETIFIQLEWLRQVRDMANAPDFATVSSMQRASDTWIEKVVLKNPISAIALPAFNRAVMNARGKQAQAAVLQTACMMRIAELHADAGSTMPRTLQELSERVGKPVLLDPLAAKPGDTIIYLPQPEFGTYTLRHAPSVKPYEGYPPHEYHGTWSPTKR